MNKIGLRSLVPFTAGVLVGGLAMYIYANKKEISQGILVGIDKGKSMAKKAKESGLEILTNETKSVTKQRKLRTKKASPKPTIANS